MAANFFPVSTAPTVAYVGSLGAGISIPVGSLAMMADGDVVPAGDPTSYCLTLSGVDANGDIAVYASQSNVRVRIVDPMANNQVLKVTVTWSSTLDISISQSTGGAGALTGTANDICEAVRAHGVAGGLVRLAPTGTGASVTSAVAYAAVPYISLLGFAQEFYDNPSGMPVSMDMYFDRWFFGEATTVGPALPTVVKIGTKMGVDDGIPTLNLPPGPLDLLVEFTGIDSSGNIAGRVL